MVRESVTRKSAHEIELMFEASQIVGRTLALLRENVKPGVTTEKLNKIAHEYILSQGAYPVFLGYMNYPKSICASVNDEVVHGIPSKKCILKEGDIISLDVGAIKNNFCGDAAITVAVGEVSELAKKLIRVTEESFYAGIKYAYSGNYLGDISNAVQAHAESQGFSVVREYVGHGIGRKMHEAPAIPNFGKRGTGIKLDSGMCLAIEPMINAGGYDVKTLSNQWTVVTTDGSLSAHYEHTVAITDEGPRILSKI
ncbi:MAG: type I methionyl aminopeptidase [Candidatus Wallbacteria bacterium]